MTHATTASQRQRDAVATLAGLFGHGVRRAAAVDDRITFLEWCRKFLPHYFTEEPNEMHEHIGSVLEDCRTKRGQRVVEVAPRGYAKTTLTSVAYALYAICEGFEPYILLGSETTAQARMNLASVKRELTRNERIAIEYPVAVGRGDEWNKDSIVTRTGVLVQAVGSGKSIRGRHEGENRPSLVIIDDPDGEESLYSPAAREHIHDWFFNAVEKVGSPITNIIVVGTMIHDACLVGVLRETPGWCVGPLWQAIMSWPTRMDLWERWEALYADRQTTNAAEEWYEENRAEMDEGARVLWPDREPLVMLMIERQRGGHPAFLREKQNAPLPPEGTRFEAAWFEGEDLWFDDPPTDKGVVCLVACDPAVGRNVKRGDFTATVWGWFVPGKRHLWLDADIEIRSPTAALQAFVLLCKTMRVENAAFETNGFQSVLAGNLNQLLAEAQQLVNVVEIEHRTPKVMRIDRLAPYLQARNFKFRRGSVGAARLFRQLKLFAVPPTEKVDGPDALEMLMQLVVRFISALESDGALRVVGSIKD